jgi:uncharacterized SAM-binding protein YcdF (DUF218 family)
VSSFRRPFRWFLAVAALLVLVLLPYRFWLAALGGYLVHAEAPARADAIVVLAGDYYGNRILTAASLVRQGFAPKALISGPADFYGLHETDLAIPFAVRHGYPESYFVAVPNDSKSTVSEAEVMLAELRKLSAQRIDIVTSNYHTRRTASIYSSRAAGMEVHVVAAPDKYFSPGEWWKNREGRKVFLMEWMKTFGSWLGM